MTVRACSRGALVLLAAAFASAPSTSYAAGPPAGALVPADLVSAYNVDTSNSANVTVAVVGAYDYAAVASDLAAYRSQFGLPACTIESGCLTVVNQSGQTSPLPGAPPSNDWTAEMALDLDMVSATCPSCKLLLVEADDDTGDGLKLGSGVAAQAGAKVIVDELGSPETSSSASDDSTYFDLPGVSIFAGVGAGFDLGGSGPTFPATSAHVIAVSSTTLTKAPATTRGWSETASSSVAGSGCSHVIAKPAFQQAILDTVCAKRATADVAAVGDLNTPVAVYNLADGGWTAVAEGATAIVAGIVAQAGLAGIGPDFFYTNASALHDVTTGSDGTCSVTQLCNAATGWDGPTGNGTPNGRALAALAAVVDAGAPSDGGAEGGVSVIDAATASDSGGREDAASAPGEDAATEPDATVATDDAGAPGSGGADAEATADATTGAGATGQGPADAGTSGSSPSGSSSAAADTSGSPATSSAGGCGCTVASHADGTRNFVLAGLVLGLTMARRRRRA
jgi:MYXO-CTERM domain-containing protein